MTHTSNTKEEFYRSDSTNSIFMENSEEDYIENYEQKDEVRDNNREIGVRKLLKSDSEKEKDQNPYELYISLLELQKIWKKTSTTEELIFVCSFSSIELALL